MTTRLVVRRMLSWQMLRNLLLCIAFVVGVIYLVRHLPIPRGSFEVQGSEVAVSLVSTPMPLHHAAIAGVGLIGIAACVITPWVVARPKRSGAMERAVPMMFPFVLLVTSMTWAGAGGVRSENSAIIQEAARSAWPEQLLHHDLPFSAYQPGSYLIERDDAADCTLRVEPDGDDRRSVTLKCGAQTIDPQA